MYAVTTFAITRRLNQMKRNSEIPEAPEKREYKLTGLYRQVDERNLDGRTKMAKVIRELKKELQAYIGEPTVATEMLLQRIIYKHLRLSAYENAFIENPENEEKQHYIPLANSLRLDLQTLKDIAGQKKQPPNLAGYLKQLKEGNSNGD
jgi:hypothetical protein